MSGPKPLWEAIVETGRTQGGRLLARGENEWTHNDEFGFKLENIFIRRRVFSVDEDVNIFKCVTNI